MPRFNSFKFAPSETRRMLRDRIGRRLAVPNHTFRALPDATFTPDVLAFQLLDRLNISCSADWLTAEATYRAACPGDNEPADLSAAADAGWLRQVWGRVKIPRDTRLVSRGAPAGAMNALKCLAMDIYKQTYSFVADPTIETVIATMIADITAERSDPAVMVVRSPDWIAARLWETSLVRTSSIEVALRHWVDLWNLLHQPDFIPAAVWSAPDLEAFRGAALGLLASEPALGDWTTTCELYQKQAAIARNQMPLDSAWRFPEPTITLVGRALWCEQGTVERYLYESLEAGNDLFGLMRLLLADADGEDHSAAPHPMAAQILELAMDRAELFLAYLFYIRRRPRLLADLLMDPRSAALACLIIAQWQPVGGAWDRELIERDHRREQSDAFADAVAMLGIHLRGDRADAHEAAALFAWLHRRSGRGNVDDLFDADSLMAALRRELSDCPRTVLLAMARSFDNSTLDRGPGSPEFASLLDLVELGDLSSDLEAETIICAYERSLASAEYTLSAHRIGVSSAAALARISERSAALRKRFLYPIEIRARLLAIDPEDNPYTVAENLGRALRVHIRVLCRAVIAGSKDASPDLTDALIAAVKSGALEHKEKGRIAAFAPHFEKPIIGQPSDRPLAADLMGALNRLSGPGRAALLAAVLETDEPMVLAQLLSLAGPHMRNELEKRLTALAPASAGAIHSLTEMQARIDELLTAGATEAAALYMDAEAKLNPLGKPKGRELIQFQNKLRLAFLQEDWTAIASTVEPSLVGKLEQESARETLMQFRGLAALKGPNPDPVAAKSIFQDLFRKRPSLGFAINWFAAAISDLLQSNIFVWLNGEQERAGRSVINTIERMVTSLPGDARDDVLNTNRALLLLALDEPSQALGFLSTVTSPRLQDAVAAYRAVALARLARLSEATATLDEAEHWLGSTPVLAAARTHIASGAAFLSVPAVSVYEDLFANVASAIARFRNMNPSDQARVLQQHADPLEGLLVEYVRAAADALVALKPMMTVVTFDDCEDDLNALFQQLLAARVQFLNWSVADQSKGGYSARNNPGERDMLITRGNTILAIVEALICARPLTYDVMVADLESHFQKLLGYGNPRIFFHVTYAFIEDKAALMSVLQNAAEVASPHGFTFLDREPIPHEDSQPAGFIARYAGEFGDVKVVFLILNMGQQRQRSAAEMAGNTKRRSAPKKPKAGNAELA